MAQPINTHHSTFIILSYIFTHSTASFTSWTRRMEEPFIKAMAWMAVVPLRDVVGSPPTSLKIILGRSQHSVVLLQSLSKSIAWIEDDVACS